MSIDNSHQISDVKVMISQGADGVGIESIEKTSSQGIEDTYTITLSDGRKSVFTVTNGNGIDHIAKTGEQGLVDEYTIYFDDNSTYVYYVTNGQGGGMSAEFLITSEVGSTITVTNPSGQSVPVSQVTGSTTEWTCSDTQYGTYVVESDLSGDIVTVNVTVDSCKIYSVNALHRNVPNGSTVTPTDDIQIWLNCADIWDKSYTTLSEVLADTDTLVALMANDNAVDYLVRSTTWATDISADETAMQAIGASDYCSDTLLGDSTWKSAILGSTYWESVLNAKVPTMTSNTTPRGVCSSSSHQAETTDAYKAFDGSTSTGWQVAYASGSTWIKTNSWVAYDFGGAKVIKKVYILPYNSNSSTGCRIKNYKIEASNDGTTWETLYTGVYSISESGNTITINNDTAYRYYRLYVVDIYDSSNVPINVIEVQFYGRQNGGVQTWLHEADITDKDYTTLAEVLADSTTLSALMASQDAVDYLVTCKGWADTICADQTAMSYIGLNNYCANTLLADSTWCNAICNSTYFESVLNVKVPTMTSNTTPSGTASASSSNADAYKAFDASDSSYYTAEVSGLIWVAYEFPSAVNLVKYICTARTGSSSKSPRTCYVQYYDEGTSSWVNINSYEIIAGTLRTLSGNTSALINTKKIRVSDQDALLVTDVKFYGREDV